MLECRHCGTEVTEDARWILGWGRLCSDCEERAEIRIAPSGIARSVAIEPPNQDDLEEGSEQ